MAWRWHHDGVVLDAPEGFAFAVDPVELGIVDASGRVPRLDQMTTVRLPPPFAQAKQVVGERKWRLRLLGEVVALVGAVVILVWLLYLSENAI